MVRTAMVVRMVLLSSALLPHQGSIPRTQSSLTSQMHAAQQILVEDMQPDASSALMYYLQSFSLD